MTVHETEPGVYTFRTTFGGVVAVLPAALAMLHCPPSARAHDLPDAIRIQAFVRPQGERLDVLVRLPLVLLQNMDLPKRGPGHLDLAHIDAALQTAAEVTATEIILYEGPTALEPDRATTRISLPSNQAFASYTAALSHIHGPPLPVDTEVFWNQGFFDVHLAYPIRSDRARLAIDVRVAPGLGRNLETIVAFMPPGKPMRTYELIGGEGRVALDPRWHQAGRRFVRSGFVHILSGTDHLLFLLCLVIPLRRFRSLLLVVTAFTVAHSITLIGAALGASPVGEWFSPLIETGIAASIVYMGIENVLAVNLRRRWIITFAFGLIHGFGFSFALRESLQFAGSHLLLSLLSFNVGVELGQICVLLVFLAALALLSRTAVDPRLATIVLSVLVVHTAWHWMIERGTLLWRVEWPVPDAEKVTTLSRWLLLFLLAGGLAWTVARRRRPVAFETPTAEEGPA